jgi:3-isopropylmalate/(R)-2-methylmalate dehydratase small subunit
MLLQGKAHVYKDHVDTDVIIPARYLNTANHRELAAHCMEDIDPAFISTVAPGDIIAAGVNFGCGSSREHAPIAIKASGISCVVAKSFARIFYRNAINTGLPIIISDIIIDTGDEVRVDLDRGSIENLSKGLKAEIVPFPPFLQNVIASGGLMQAMKGGGL